jgi:hypothetical protein
MHLAAAGALAGLAIVEKPTGIFLPVLGVLALLLLRRTTRVPLTAALALFAPAVVAFGAYLVRNQMAHGSPDFRFGGLEWMWKDGKYEAMMALYERAPRSLETIRSIGLTRVMEITGEQLAQFARATFSLRPVVPRDVADVLAMVAVPAFLPSLAILALPGLTRRAAPLAALTGTTFVALPAVVCVLWHAEPRYFALFIPLAAIAVAGALGRSTAGLAAMAALVLVSAVGLVSAAGLLAGLPRHACQPVLDHLAATGIPGRILTFDPWSVAWLADREAVMIPSGGVDAIARVARRYDTRLLLTHPMIGRPQTSALVGKLEGTVGPLRVTTLHAEGTCRLATVDVLGESAP